MDVGGWMLDAEYSLAEVAVVPPAPIGPSRSTEVENWKLAVGN